jgi:putative colanic acid biosynthesis UDP-glucose lipid carrier transferase
MKLLPRVAFRIMGNLSKRSPVCIIMSVTSENALRAVRDNWLVEDRAWLQEGIEKKKGYFLLKRSFDLLFSALVIAGILSWLLPLLSILIKLDSRGPVFFVQKRVGRNSRLFSCYKLRSMLINDLADERPASGSDRRITRLGNWLRRTHLDELPQFFNVLMGAMSIVGPRPYMLSDCRDFAGMVPDGAFRHRVKPGITGLAQARGLHGSTNRDRFVIAQRYRWDAFYVSNADFQLDIRILRLTIRLLLHRRPKVRQTVHCE